MCCVSPLGSSSQAAILLPDVNHLCSQEDDISNWERWGENSPEEWSSRVNILDSMKGPLNLAALVSGEKLRVGWELET